MSSNFTETPDQRRARYARLAIAAAAAAARNQSADVKTAYLLLAESWYNLSKSVQLPGDADLEPRQEAEANPSAQPGIGDKNVHN